MTGIVDTAGVGAGAGVAPARTLTVESSRMAIVCVGGSVPCQPGVFCNGKVRCSACRAAGEGMMADLSSLEVRGLKDAKSVRESRILSAK